MAIRQGRSMFKLQDFGLTARKTVTYGALAIGTLALSATASAAPLPMFPFILTPPIQSQEAVQQPQVQTVPDENAGSTVEMPARLKRQVVSYPTHEAPGTVIIDTPNTYL